MVLINQLVTGFHLVQPVQSNSFDNVFQHFRYPQGMFRFISTLESTQLITQGLFLGSQYHSINPPKIAQKYGQQPHHIT